MKLYIKIVTTLHTPFVYFLDRKYKSTTQKDLLRFYDGMKDMAYSPEFSDCDNFAFVFKGIADRETNAVGIVIGKLEGGMHCWNMAYRDGAIVQIEPQTGYIFTRDKRYKPLVILI